MMLCILCIFDREDSNHKTLFWLVSLKLIRYDKKNTINVYCTHCVYLPLQITSNVYTRI